jgi:hypothetical protein
MGDQFQVAVEVRGFGRYKASGRFVELPYMDWWIVRNGRVVDNWGMWSSGLLIPAVDE